jgi:alkanesulfonate monooxygenase SsuD/methylene tetrahydromethanopterin reductase-like flavin-dependent oxidoreductase (luciferase family)
MMNTYPAGAAAEADFARLRAYAEQAGRDSASIGVEVWVSTGAGDEANWREEFKFRKSGGVTHATLNATFQRNHHRRIGSRSLQAHLTAIDRYRDAVADRL